MSQVRVVGVDGGATRTRVVIADESGRELARSEGGPGIIGESFDDRVTRDVVRQVRALAGELECPLPVDALCAGFAGAAGRPSARQNVCRSLEASGTARTVTVVSDSRIAFADAFGEGPGILVIGGTGSIGLGRAGEVSAAQEIGAKWDESLLRVGGWGRLLGDEGSAFGLGLMGLRAAVRGAERRGPPTELTARLFADLDVEGPQGAFEWSETASKAQIAALAPIVAGAADDGDAEACRLVDRAVGALVAHAVALRERLDGEVGLTVALVGGLIEPGGSLRARVERAFAASGFTCLDRVVDPVRGAVSWALR